MLHKDHLDQILLEIFLPIYVVVSDKTVAFFVGDASQKVYFLFYRTEIMDHDRVGY